MKKRNKKILLTTASIASIALGTSAIVFNVANNDSQREELINSNNSLNLAPLNINSRIGDFGSSEQSIQFQFPKYGFSNRNKWDFSYQVNKDMVTTTTNTPVSIPTGENIFSYLSLVKIVYGTLQPTVDPSGSIMPPEPTNLNFQLNPTLSDKFSTLKTTIETNFPSTINDTKFSIVKKNLNNILNIPTQLNAAAQQLKLKVDAAIQNANALSQIIKQLNPQNTVKFDLQEGTVKVLTSDNQVIDENVLKQLIGNNSSIQSDLLNISQMNFGQNNMVLNFQESLNKIQEIVGNPESLKVLSGISATQNNEISIITAPPVSAISKVLDLDGTLVNSQLAEAKSLFNLNSTSQSVGQNQYDLNRVNAFGTQGEDYTILYDLGSFTLSENDDSILKFSYSRNGQVSVSGSLIFKKEFDKTLTLADNAKKMNIFGRWSVSGNSFDVVKDSQDLNSPTIETFKNFVFKYDQQTNKIQLFARLKQNEKIERLSLKQGSNTSIGDFGLKDFQFTPQSTYLDALEAGNTQQGYTPRGKLINLQTYDANVLPYVQFFSPYITSNVTGKNINETEVLEGGTTFSVYRYFNNSNTGVVAPTNDFKLPLFYLLKSSTLSSLNYLPLKETDENGNLTNQQIQIDLKFDRNPDGTLKIPTLPPQININQTIINNLKQIVQDQLELYSTITLETKKLNTDNSFVKETINYSNICFGIGNRYNGWSGIDSTQNTRFNLSLASKDQYSQDVIDALKIFPQKPWYFDEQQTTTLPLSKTFAKKAINSTNEVLTEASKIYNTWATNNQVPSTFATQNQEIFIPTQESLNFTKVVSVPIIDVNGSISTFNGEVNGTELYQKMLDSYNNMVNILNTKVLPADQQLNLDIYKPIISGSINGSSNTPSIIMDYLINSPYITNYSIVSEAFNSMITTFTNKDVVSVRSDVYSKALFNLMIQQFFAIQNQFQVLTSKNSFIHLFVQLFNDPLQTSSFVLNNPSQYLKLAAANTQYQGVSLLSVDDKNNNFTNQETSIKLLMTSIWNLLSFRLPNANAVLGNAIFPLNTTSGNLINQINQTTSQQGGGLTSQSLVPEIEPNNDFSEKLSFIYNELFNFFGFNLNEDITNFVSLNQGPITLETFKMKNRLIPNDNKEYTIKEAIIFIANQLKIGPNSDKVNYINENLGNNIWSINNLVAGYNAIQGLQWRLNILQQQNNSPQPQTFNFNNFALDINNNQNLDPAKINEEINRIQSLLYQQQGSQVELNRWSEATKNSYNNFVNNFSIESLNQIWNTFAQITSFDAIMYTIPILPGEPATAKWQEIVQYILFATLTAAGIGVIAASAIVISNRSKNIKLSSRPVIKYLNVGGIALGVCIIVAATIFVLLPVI